MATRSEDLVVITEPFGQIRVIGKQKDNGKILTSAEGYIGNFRHMLLADADNVYICVSKSPGGINNIASCSTSSGCV